MLTFDRQARRIAGRSAVQFGQLWIAAQLLPTIRTYNKRYGSYRAPLWWGRVWSRTVIKIGRARSSEWRAKHAA